MNKEDMIIEEDIYEWYNSKEDRLNEERKGCPVLLIGRSPVDSKVHVVATVPANLSGIINAAEWVKHVTEILGGRGGGTAIFAQGGGDKVDLIGKAVESGSRFIEEKLQEEKLRNEKNEEEYYTEEEVDDIVSDFEALKEYLYGWDDAIKDGCLYLKKYVDQYKNR